MKFLSEAMKNESRAKKSPNAYVDDVSMSVTELKNLINNPRLSNCLKDFSNKARVFWFDEANDSLYNWFVEYNNVKTCDSEGVGILYYMESDVAVIDFTESGFNQIALVLEKPNKFRKDHNFEL